VAAVASDLRAAALDLNDCFEVPRPGRPLLHRRAALRAARGVAARAPRVIGRRRRGRAICAGRCSGYSGRSSRRSSGPWRDGCAARQGSSAFSWKTSTLFGPLRPASPRCGVRPRSRPRAAAHRRVTTRRALAGRRGRGRRRGKARRRRARAGRRRRSAPTRGSRARTGAPRRSGGRQGREPPRCTRGLRHGAWRAARGALCAIRACLHSNFNEEYPRPCLGPQTSMAAGSFSKLVRDITIH